MQIIHYLSIDLARQLPMPPIGAVQGDASARAVEISLLENGAAWEVPAGITAAVAFRKPDMTKGLYDTLPDKTKAVTITGSTVTAILAPQVLSCAGEVSAAVVFHDSKRNQLATFPFVIRVAANPAAGKQVSNDYYRYSTMEEVSAAVEAALAAVEDSKQDFLAKAEEALNVVHDTASADAPAIIREASGETVTVADAANRPLSGLSLYGKTTQDGTPTPENPAALVSVGAGGGIAVSINTPDNLLPAAVAREVTVSGITFTAYNDGTYRMRGTSTGSNASTRFLLPMPLRLPDTGMLIFEPRAETDRTDVVMAFHTTLENGAYTQLAYRSLYKNEEVNALRGKVITATSLFLASAGATIDITLKPSIRYSDRIDLADTDFVESRYQPLTASTPGGLPGIPVDGGGNYTDENGQQWVCDEIDFARGVYVQRLATIDMGQLTYIDKGNHRYEAMLQYKSRACSETEISDVLCEVYKKSSFADILSDKENNLIGIVEEENIAWLELIDRRALPAEELKSSLSGRKAIYILATATETPLSAEELAAFAALHSNYSDTTVFNDSSAGMKLSYVADTKTYIDNKLAAISAAMLGA